MGFAALGLLVAAATAAPAPVADTFQVGTVTMHVPIPAGFCKPTSPTAQAAAQMQAAADETNVTLSTLFTCGVEQRSPDYFLIKTPKGALFQTVDRASLLTQLAEAMKLPQFATPDPNATNDQVEKQLEKVIGQRPDLEGAIKPLGRDGICVYMGGVIAVSNLAVSYKRAVSTCITAVGNKVVAVYRFSEGETATNVTRHLATARAMALTMTADAAK